MINIYSITREILLSVPVLSSAISHKELMNSDYIQLEWESDEYTVIPAGSYIEHKGERYALLEPYYPVKKNDLACKYSPQFQSRIIRWQKAFVPVYTYEADGETVKARELDWTFTGTPSDAMYMVQQALRHETGEEWNIEVGEDLPETITLSAQSATIWSILSEIAELCETEWWAKKEANYLYLSKCVQGVYVTLEVGRNIKVPSVSQSAENAYFTRFYAFGSTRNVTQTDSVVQSSIVKKRLTLDPKKYPMGYKDIKGHFENGVFVSDLRDEEVFPTPLYFEGVYPSSALRIASVRKRMRYHLDDDGNKIRKGGTDENPIYDEYAIWYFQIPGFSFSEELIIENQTLSVAFKSGKLRGREFELAYHPESKKVADKADVDQEFSVIAGEYEIMMDDSIEGFIIPDDDYMIPEDGNDVTLFNIKMPQEYTSSAMVELEEELDKEIAERLKDNKSYEFNSNPVAFYEDNTNVEIGQPVRFINGETLLETRVLMVEKHLDYSFEQKIRVGNEIIKGARQQLREEVREIGEAVSRLRELEHSSSIVRRDHSRELRQAVGRFYAMQDSLELLKGAVDGFEEGITPITVHTMAMLVGDESLQFRFTKNRTTLEPLGVCPLVYDPVAKQLNATSCALIHMTLGLSREISTSYPISAYKSWNMETWHSEVLEDTKKAYYVYAKVEKRGTRGTYALSETPMPMEQTDYYHFFVGILNAEYSDTRELVTLYGFTEVLPGQISTDVIRSADGNMIIDLVNAVITARNGARIVGEVEFSAGSSGLENLAEWSEKQNQIDKAQGDADTAKTNASNAQTIANTANASVQTLNTRIDGVDQTIAEINNKLDGVVESFFEPYTPSKTNEPASTWIGTEEEHIGDTFTNTSTSGEDAGKSWRWLKQSDGTYDWQLIADSDASKALALAGQAMDSANSKTTTFLVTPSNYKKNDIWIVGDDVPSGFAFKKGDILVTNSDSASYVANHWSKFINYSDEFQKELDASVSALEKAIEDAETASQNYTEEAKTALQESIDALDKAKADMEDVYDKYTVDGMVSASEQGAIDASKKYVEAQNKVLDEQIKAWADGEIDKAEQDAIDAANAELEEAKRELDAAIAAVEGLANTAIANANNAASKADEATTEASSAKEMAEAAKSVSESASELAQEAKDNASTAIDNASEAVTKADTAQGIASAAQNLANEAKELSQQANTNAEQAKNNADKAMEDAQTANDTLGAWAGDGISPIEKKGYEEEMVSIHIDYFNITNDAYKYGLTEDDNYTAFIEAYDVYKADLTEIVQSQEEVVPAPKDFSNHLSMYYANRANLLQAISTKAKEVADDAQKAADDAQKTADDANDLAAEAKEFAEIAKQAADDANKLISAVDGDTVLTGLEKQSLRESISRITSITDSTKLLGPVKRQVGKYEISNVLGTIGSKVVKSGDTNNGYSQNAYVGWNALNGIGDTKTNATRMVFSLDKPADVTIQYQSNAESRYDYLVLGALDVALDLTKVGTYTSENKDITKPSSTAGNQDKVFSKTFPLTAGTHFIDVCYRKDGSQSTNTDAGYFRVISDEYGKVDGYVTRAVGKGSFPTFYNKLADDGNEEQADVLHDCLVDLLDLLLDNDVWEEGNTTVFAEFRSELKGLVAEYCGYEAETVKNLASDWEYLKTAFSKGDTDVSGGVVMTNMVAVKDADEEEVEAFLNGSDFGYDEEHRKLILAAGIPEGTDALDERAKSAATRIYEDGTIDTNKLLAKGGMIGGLYLEDGRLFCKDSDGNVVIEISPESAILNSKPQYYGRLFSQAILSGASDASDANSAFRLSLAGLSSEEAPENQTLFFIDGGSQFGNRDNAIAIGRGMVAGFRPKCVVLYDGETHNCTSYDHTLISNSAGTYTNVIVLPEDPQDGQEIKIWKNNAHILKVRTSDGRQITRLNILTSTEHGIDKLFVGTLDLVYHSSIGSWLMIIHETY